MGSDKLTLAHFLYEDVRNEPQATGELASLINDIAAACKAVAKLVNHGDLAGDLFFDITTFTNAFACADPHGHHPPGVICDNKEVSGHDIGVTKVSVHMDDDWGPYATCNICVSNNKK